MKRAVLIALLLVFVAGCTTYYKVTDPGTGKAYYTTNVHYKGSGAVEITDEKTGAKVVLQSSEVQEISEQEFKRGAYSE